MKQLIFIVSILLFSSCTITEYTISNKTPEENLYTAGWDCEKSSITFKNKTRDTVVRWIDDREIKLKPKIKTVVKVDPGKYVISAGWWESVEVKAYPCWEYTEIIEQ